MLDEIINKGLYSFYDKADSREDSIRKSCETLIENGIVDKRYPEQIISTVKKYGPYIVLVPGVAMPHCQENAEGVNDTAVSFMKVEKSVVFDPDDREKDARIFFTVASEDPDKHLANIAALADILSDDNLVYEFTEAHNVEDLKRIQKKYNI